jgi:hypothetical protein
METRKRTPLELFTLPQHFHIPLFQRPYVWEETDQWAPLWQDIRRTAEARINSPHIAKSHFLGAVVLQAADSVPGDLTTWIVIDGQQRLTTLQLVMSAAKAVLEAEGMTRAASKLSSLTHNQEHFIPEGASDLKVRHLNKDQPAFDEVMGTDGETSGQRLLYADSRIARARAYFLSAISDWLYEGGSELLESRAELLTDVLQGGLQLVSIDLTPAEDSQEIFETLNARGTPLTASDLVRNFVFQRLNAEGADSRTAYERDWPFESKFWETEVSVGRQLVSRSSLFLNQWLVSRLGEEVSPYATFSSFKAFVESDPSTKIVNLLPAMRRQADAYQSWTEAAARPDGNLTALEMSVYRMRASGIELLKPLLIWLTAPDRDLPDVTVEAVLGAFESWLYRRQLLRLTNSDLGRVVAEVIRGSAEVPAAELAGWVTAYLARLKATSTYWPGDEEVRVALTNEPVYRRYPRGRLRMFLETIEDAYRSETRQPQVLRAKLPIEHVLPQRWDESWPVSSPEDEVARAAHVHQLGNLTLLTTSLNSKVSNGPWSSKREALLHHNTMTLTGRIVASTEGRRWDEALIDERTQTLISTLLLSWPVPEGHLGIVVDPLAKQGEGIEVIHLIEHGLLTPGDTLSANHRALAGTFAKVLSDGKLSVRGEIFASPSAAGKKLLNRATNGWTLWALPDGRRLKDLRTELIGERAAT